MAVSVFIQIWMAHVYFSLGSKAETRNILVYTVWDLWTATFYRE